MNVLLIGYDPTIDTASKTTINRAIKSQPKWARVMPNVFIVVTPLKTAEMRDTIIKAKNEKVIVYNVTNAAWGTNKVDSEVTAWLKNNWQQ